MGIFVFKGYLGLTVPRERRAKKKYPPIRQGMTPTFTKAPCTIHTSRDVTAKPRDKTKKETRRFITLLSLVSQAFFPPSVNVEYADNDR